MDLFDSGPGKEEEEQATSASRNEPLAQRMRPRNLDEFTGQTEIVAPGAPLRQLIERDELRSLIFWGPPGTGKTTLASIIAQQSKAKFLSLSAVTASIKDAKAIMEGARLSLERGGRRTILFVDEIHRFNKAQQDAFLPFVEEGSIILIGATTENPSFSVISALLSRCKIFVLGPLMTEDLSRILRMALEDTERGLGNLHVQHEDGVLEQIAGLADGDARRALNLLELAVQITAPSNAEGPPVLTRESLKQVLQRQHLLYDKSGEEHYNLISALHKSMRGSDAQASVYWLERMLQAGEDPLYVARRMIRFASEDIGNADPQALQVALSCREAYHLLGKPEGELALLQCAVYLATAPKSNAAYMAEHAVKKEIENTGALPAPMHIRNAPTGLMKDLGYGKGYAYDHDDPEGFSGQEHLPDAVRTRAFYKPGPYGFEKEIARRMEWWEKKREERQK